MNLTEQLNSIINDLQGVWTETTLILGAIVLLVVGLLKSSTYITKSIFGLIVVVALWHNLANQQQGALLSNSLYISENTVLFGSLFLLATLLILLFSRDKKHATEFYFFVLALLAGSLLMMKANSLLIVYLSIELVSFSSYILTNFSGKKQGFEAGIKYLLFGAISSAIMLFGLGLAYGGTGVFSLAEFSVLTSLDLLSEVGLMMLLIGILFKISIVPAHIWVPSTYQLAPADATALMSVVPKLAGLVLLQRLMAFQALGNAHWIMTTMVVLGILTIAVGTLGAFNQKNVRRMISFGAIAHSGFLLPFALVQGSTAQESFWLYAVVYAVMNIGVFYMLDCFEKKGIYTLTDYASQKTSAWMGVTFTLILISLVGLPPMAGFMAKFFLFTTLWEYYSLASSTIYLWYLVIAVLATVGSLFYYLQVPKHVFLAKKPSDQSINFGLLPKIIATLFSIALLLLFFAPKLVIVMQQLLNNVHE